MTKIYRLITIELPSDPSIVIYQGTKEEVRQFIENNPDWEPLNYPGHEREGANCQLQVLTLIENK